MQIKILHVESNIPAPFIFVNHPPLVFLKLTTKSF